VFGDYWKVTGVAMKASLLLAVEEKLNQHGFRSMDFAISDAKDSRKRPIILVRYRHHQAYSFSATLPLERNEERSSNYKSVYVIECSLTPGSIGDQEVRKAEDTDGLLAALSQWLGYLQQELDALPTRRAILEQQAQLQELFEHIQQLPDEFMSREEALEVTARLVQLEDQLVARLEAAAKDQDALKKELADLHRDFDEMRTQLQSHTKRGWLGSAAVRLRRWVTDPDNKKLLQTTLELGQKLLPPGS